MMDCQIRPASLSDADSICTVLRRSISECCHADHQNDPAKLAAWLRNKTTDHVRLWLQAQGVIALLAQDAAQQVVGFASCAASGEVLLCYILPEVQFRGVGKALLAALEARARSAGLSRLFLESTLSAEKFYLRNGFCVSGPAEVAFGIPELPGMAMQKML